MIPPSDRFSNLIEATSQFGDRQHLMTWPAVVAQRIRHAGVIATVTIDDPADAIPLAEVLMESGLAVMELTLRTSSALAALRAIRKAVPEMLVGAGTVLRPDQVDEVADAGAEFAVAPGTNPRVIKASILRGLPFAPGVATPSDIEIALEQGCRLLKFFPAEPLGGLAYLESMAAPYRHLGCHFLPLGGLDGNNLGDYLRHPLVWAVGGSWIAPAKLIQEKQWALIRDRATTARNRALEFSEK